MINLILCNHNDVEFMMYITICDDEHSQIEYLKDLVQEWLNKKSLKASISSFENAESFLFAYEDNKIIDILLLDIQMGNMDGVELAKQLRKDNESVQIIFITGYPDFIAEGYNVSALNYLMKPVTKDKLFEVLDKAEKNLVKQQKSILLDTGITKLRIMVDNIIYIEARNHDLDIHTVNEMHKIKMPLYEMKNKLPDEFIYCHRSYIVNIYNIKKITRTEVTLDCGQILPLSRRLYSDVNKAMIKYLTGGFK